MVRSWGPVEKPVEHNVKPIASEAEGAVTEIDHLGGKTAPDNYSATDARHSKATSEGWESVDPRSGENVGSDGKAHSRFPDGPGKWRQT